MLPCFRGLRGWARVWNVNSDAQNFMEKVLSYQCPKCEEAAFYLSGGREDYVNGTELKENMIRQIISSRGIDKGGCITCQSCRFPFTTGVLYLKNIKEMERG